jgi:hypothetical protein
VVFFIVKVLMLGGGHRFRWGESAYDRAEPRSLNFLRGLLSSVFIGVAVAARMNIGCTPVSLFLSLHGNRA